VSLIGVLLTFSYLFTGIIFLIGAFNLLDLFQSLVLRDIIFWLVVILLFSVLINGFMLLVRSL